MRSTDELAELQLVCPGAKEMEEGGITYVYLPALAVPGQGLMQGLLCPQAKDNYTTRLFLERPVLNKGANWRCFSILGRGWHTMSWQNVPASLRLVEILSAHLDPLR